MPSTTHQSAVSARGDRLLAFLLDFSLLTAATVAIWFVFLVLRLLTGFAGMVGLAALRDAASAGGSATVATPVASLGTMVLGYGLGLLQWAVIGLVLAGYFVYFLSRRGQTIGMRATDVVVRSADGTACTQSQAITRTAVLLAPLPVMALSSVFIPIAGFPLALLVMVGWLAVEAVVLYTDDSARRLGDRFADTVVVEATD